MPLEYIILINNFLKLILITQDKLTLKMAVRLNWPKSSIFELAIFTLCYSWSCINVPIALSKLHLNTTLGEKMYKIARARFSWE